MIRYKIKNEYELGKPKLREAGNRDDPEAILEGVAMAGLVGLLRQLGDLAEFAAEIFHGLHEEVIGAAARGNGLMVRVQQLEAEFPLIEKGVLCQNYSKVSSNMGVDWHANLKLDHNPITKGDMPRFIMESYEKCHEPPQLFMLDKFDIYGAGACLKRFSDPSFFKTTLASSGMLQEDTRREKRTRRVMNTGVNSINFQISKTRTLSNFIPNLDKEDFDQVSEEIPVRRVKLKHRQLNRSEADDIRSCMEHLLEMDLLEHKVLLTNHSDSHESATDIRYNVVDAALNMNGNLDTACSPINEGDKLKVKSKDFQDILPEHSIQVSRYLTSSKPDNDNMFSEDENKTEDDSADSPSSEVLSIPSSSRVYHMDYLPDCGNEAVGSNSGYISDDPPTEPDSYMDALTTMDSEVETDTESKGRCLGGFEKPSSNPFITESNATLSNLRSNGSVDTTQETIELNNVSDSSVKILHKNDIYVDDESTCKSKNLVIPSERNDNELCQELAEASDSFSGSLQQMEKKLLQVKHDGQHSQVVEQQGVEYVAGSLHIPEVKQDLTKQEMEAGFIVLPRGITGEINNAIAPLDSLASLKAEVGVKIGYTLSEGKSNNLQHKVEFLPSESSNRQHEEMKGSMHASNHYASISNILEDDLQMETPINSTVTDIVINESGAENYDPHTVGSPSASVLNDQLQKQSASQEISAVARPNCAPCTLSSSKPSEVPLLDDASHISSLQLEEVDGHPSIGKSIPVETSDSDNNYGRKSIPNSSNWSSEEQMPSTVFFPIKGSNPFDGPIEVQGGDAADALSFQITGEHANHSLLFDKGPFDEQKSYLHKFGDPVNEQFPTDIVESHDSLDSEASPQIPIKIAMEDNPPLQFLPGADLFIKANNFPLSSKSTMISIQDSKHLEPSVWQDENGSSYENMNIHCNLVDIVSEESEKEPRREMHSVISNSGNKELKVPPLDKIMHGQLVQIGFNPLESYAARCAAPDLHATVRNREIDHIDIPPSNETKFEQDGQKESSVPPKCGVEIYDNSLASKSRKLPIPIFSRPSRINFENTQQSSRPFSSELNFNSQFQGNTALSKNTEVTPPLPPLPPAEWRLLKLQVGPLSSSGKTAQPLCFALPNPFAAFPTLAKNPLQDLQVQEIESANQYVPLLQGETKIPLYVSSSSEKEMAQYLDRQVHVHDESHHHNTLQMEGTMVNPFLISSTEDSNRLYGNEAYGEISIQPPNPFPELGQQSAPSLALSHGENWRALNSSDLTLGFEDAISKLNQINPSLEKERSLDVQLSTMEEEKLKFSTSFPNGDAQIPKLSTSFHSKEHKSSDHDNLSSRKESPSTSEDNSAPMLATEKPINKIPTIPKPPKYPLFEVTSHDRSMLRKVPKMVQPANKSMADNRNSMLEQIRNKSFSLKPALSRRPNVMGRPSTNLKVVAILERANAIRQAVASDDDEDSWSDS